jgi:4a-hydroxytetrahydrobiopterin dehydratase
MTMTDPAVALVKKKCRPCASGQPPMSEPEIARMLPHLPGWEYRAGVITKTFTFSNYDRTMAFVNATAWISHREDHHPDLNVGYNKCRVDYCTHAIGGISENDFICAAKLEALFSL